MMISKSIKLYCYFVFPLTITFVLLPISSSRRAWSAPGNELIEDAKSEGKLVLYHSPNVSNYQPIIKAFKEKYPFITVDSFYASSSNLVNKVLAEEKAKKYTSDIVDVRGFGINILKEKGVLMKYSAPNFKFIPPEFIDPEGYYWANCVTIEVIAYNTNLVSQNDVPKSYDDLLNPKWKGKLYLTETEGYEWYGNVLTIMGKEKGQEFMKKLSKQNIQFRVGTLLLASLVAAGEAPVFLTAAGHTIEQFREKGAPVKWVVFDPPLGKIGAMGITLHAAHPNSAKLFVNFLSSREGQDLIAINFGKNPTRVDAKHRYANLDIKGQRLFLSSVTTDYNKFRKEFRGLFMNQS